MIWEDKRASKWQNTIQTQICLSNMGPFPSLLPPCDCTLAQAPRGTVLVVVCAGVGVS